jgi:hypothetical protein
MPQTTGAMNTVNALIEVSADGLTWTNISGSSNKIEPPVQTADTGSAATLEGDYKVVTVGKYNPVEIAVTILYTEVAAEAFAFLHTQNLLPGHPLYLRWSPGGYNGEDRFKVTNATGTTAPGRISELQLPGADGEAAGPTLLTFKVMATRVTKEHLTPSPSASLSPSASASA